MIVVNARLQAHRAFSIECILSWLRIMRSDKSWLYLFDSTSAVVDWNEYII